MQSALIWILLSSYYININAIKIFVNPFKANINSVTDDGSKWIYAFINLEQALNYASQRKAANQNLLNLNIYLVGNYTYKPDTTQRDNCFQTVPEVAIYGGFTGDKSEKSDADRTTDEVEMETYKTIISGNINDPNDNSQNCYHVITYEKNLILDRVVISDGNANYNQPDGYSDQTNALHRYGGGLISYDAKAIAKISLQDVVFRDNTALNGGAMWFHSNSKTPVDVDITDCLFENNQAIAGKHEGGYGGAIYHYHLAAINILASDFIKNSASYRGGAVYTDYGGVLNVKDASFISNTASYGGALFAEDRNSQTNGTFPVIADSLFENNTATIGGAICWFNHVEGTYEWNTFKNNKATKGASIALMDSFYVEDANDYINNQATLSLDNVNGIYEESEFFYNTMHDVADIDIVTSSYWVEMENIFDSEYDALDIHPYDSKSEDPICYVDGGVSASGDGSEWKKGKKDLQECLDTLQISGGDIWVKSGIYKPSRIPDWKIRANKKKDWQVSFILYDNIRIYGGFDGKEKKRTERDIFANPTYLSCDLSTDTVAMYCNQIIFAADNTLMDGFIFESAGYQALLPTRRRLKNSIDEEAVLSSTSTVVGSGIFSNSSTITIVNSVFNRLYSSTKGAAVYCIGREEENMEEFKSPMFLNVLFLNNRAELRGGAISADLNCNFECKWCIFDGNSCAKKGGAIYLDFDADIKIYDSRFDNNVAEESGGCIAADGKSLARLTDTTFRNNEAVWEGGCLYSGSGVGPGIEQGFEIEAYSHDIETLFNGNTLRGGSNSGSNDIYTWPFSKIEYRTESRQPSVAPTRQPTYSPVKDAPNILLFIIDDLHYTSNLDVTYGAPDLIDGNTYLDIEMPYLESFISQSIVFPRMYSFPKCAPSRYALLTGRSPMASDFARAKPDKGEGVKVTVPLSRLWGESEMDTKYSIPALLKPGYRTAMIGKWHLMTSDDDGKNYGCPELNSYGCSDGCSELYEQCSNLIKNYGFNVVDGYYHDNIEENDHFSHNPEWMLSVAESVIDKAKKDKLPFFIYMAATLAHEPSAIDALTKFSSADTPKGILTDDEKPKSDIMSTREEILRKTEREVARLKINSTNEDEIHEVAAAIWVDDLFGNLIDYLREKKMFDNTFILLINDHGMQAKGLLYEGGVRLVSAISYPDLFYDDILKLDDNKKKIYPRFIMPQDFITSTKDFASIIFELAHINVGAQYPLYNLDDSKNFIDDVMEEIGSQRDIALVNWETTPPKCCENRTIDIYNSHALINKQYKYIFRATNELEPGGAKDQYPSANISEQFYDLLIDSAEQYNLMNSDDISIQSEIFRFRLEMIDYLLEKACTAPNQLDCILPNITHVPEWSNYSAPTPPPTPMEFTCDFLYEYHSTWKSVLSFNLNRKGKEYRDNAESKFIKNIVVGFNYSTCGTDFNKIAYVYNFSLENRILDLDMRICCGDQTKNLTLGPYWELMFPDGYLPNAVLDPEHANAFIFNGIINSNNNDDAIGLKAIIVIDVLVVLFCICCMIAIIILFMRNKHIRDKIHFKLNINNLSKDNKNNTQLEQNGNKKKDENVSPNVEMNTYLEMNGSSKSGSQHEINITKKHRDSNNSDTENNNSDTDNENDNISKVKKTGNLSPIPGSPPDAKKDPNYTSTAMR